MNFEQDSLCASLIPQNTVRLVKRYLGHLARDRCRGWILISVKCVTTVNGKLQFSALFSELSHIYSDLSQISTARWENVC